jgi:Flp pilus assembly protein TadD
MVMNSKAVVISLLLAAFPAVVPTCVHAGDLKITIPRPGILTPVQRLNREGVEAVRKHNFKKAEELFYKAYLFDPDNAFTLNNLGYVSELQGELEQAQKFYALAASQPSEAVVDIASSRQLEGRPMKEALSVAAEPLQANHVNVEAVRLLGQGRAAEADMLLQRALKIDPNDVFALNNMGAAKEMEGEVEEALAYFDRAAKAGPDATAVVTTNSSWRGRPVSQMAAENAKKLREHIAHQNDVAEQVAQLNLRGVSAVNRNDLRSAEEAFRKAYALDPNNAFAQNNIGYVSELEGDRETAEFFYARARQSTGASAVAGVASRSTAEGKKLDAIAGDNTTRVDTKVAKERDTLQRQNEPAVLRRRDNTVVDESIQLADPDSPPPSQ